MTGISLMMRRVLALQRARDNAQNPEFKKLWTEKLGELVKLAEEGRSSYDTVH